MYLFCLVKKTNRIWRQKYFIEGDKRTENMKTWASFSLLPFNSIWKNLSQDSWSGEYIRVKKETISTGTEDENM